MASDENPGMGTALSGQAEIGRSENEKELTPMRTRIP